MVCATPPAELMAAYHKNVSMACEVADGLRR